MTESMSDRLKEIQSGKHLQEIGSDPIQRNFLLSVIDSIEAENKELKESITGQSKIIEGLKEENRHLIKYGGAK